MIKKIKLLFPLLLVLGLSHLHAARITGGDVTTTPAGSDTHVQFNDSGAFGGESDFTYNKTTNQLTVGIMDAGNYAESVRAHGALGDGVTDDTTAIQAAIDVGRDVFVDGTTSFYLLTTPLVISADNQRIFGEGRMSHIIQTGLTGAVANVFQVNSRKGVKFENLYVQPATTSVNVLLGYGFHVTASTDIIIINNTISNHSRGAILIHNSFRCRVESNTIEDGQVFDPAVSGNGQDINIFGNVSHNIIANNTIKDSCGSGISLGSSISGDVVTHNQIYGNNIDSAPVYGILVYKQNATDTIEKNIVSNNIVSNISGNFQDFDTGNYFFGTGIYIQAAESTVIDGNIIFNTNDTFFTITNQLAPGGIGVTNTRDVTITNNRVVKTNGWGGIVVRDPNTEGHTTGYALISGNQITDAGQGIFISDRNNVSVTGNAISDSDFGIVVNAPNTNQLYRLHTIVGNSINDVITGIDVNLSSSVIINSNHISTYVANGIIISTSINVVVSNNLIFGDGVAAGATGLSLSFGLSNATILGNYIQENQWGIVAEASAGISLVNNSLRNNGTDFLDNTDSISTTIENAHGLTSVEISSNGIVTQPLQSSFLVTAPVNSANTVGDGAGSTHTVEYDTEIFDLNSDFNTSTFEFTAPVDGFYQLNASVSISSTSVHAFALFNLVTSNRTYSSLTYILTNATEYLLQKSVLADMDANDTAHCAVIVVGGAKDEKVQDDATQNTFSGSLIN